MVATSAITAFVPSLPGQWLRRQAGRLALLLLLLIGSLTAFAQESAAPASAVETATAGWHRITQMIVLPWMTIGLLVVGCSLLYHEMLTPKTWGISGNLGALCVGLVFAANIYEGESGWVGVLLLLLGLVFILLEVHIYPGFGWALVGFVLMYAGMFQSLGGVRNAPFALTVTTVLFFVSGLAFLSYLPKSPAWRQVSQKLQELQEQQSLTFSALPGDMPLADETSGPAPSFLVGQQGVALTPLRPTGMATFGGIRRQVVTEGDFLDTGAALIVSRVEGERIVVDPVEQPAPRPETVKASA